MRSIFGIACCISVAAAQTGANCNVPCENYLVELENANNIYSQNVYNIGGEFASPANTIQAMCNIVGGDIQTCFVCSTGGEGLSTDASALTLLDAWWQTCVTFQAQGVNNAYACWLSIPSGSGQCATGAQPSTTQTSTTSPTPTSSASMSETSTTSSTSPTANSAPIQHTVWPGSFVSAIMAGLIDLLL